jgi:hypothetical protein
MSALLVKPNNADTPRAGANYLTNYEAASSEAAPLLDVTGTAR